MSGGFSLLATLLLILRKNNQGKGLVRQEELCVCHDKKRAARKFVQRVFFYSLIGLHAV